MKHLLYSLSALATLGLSAHAQVRVALCAAEASSTSCNFLSPQTTLMATGAFSAVDIINVTAAGGGTPTLAQLLAYDAVMVWTNSTPASNVAWGDVLADYVDAGGGVVVTVFANSTTTAGRNIAGRWQTGYEVIMDQSGNASGANHTLGTVHLPAHPVMAGVTAFTGGTTGSRPTGTALEVGASLVAEWSNGKVLVAQGASPQRIDLGFFPPNSTCSQAGWAVGGDLLMKNALLAVAGGGRFAPYGAGCAGTLGVPTLAAAPGSRPVLGGSFQLDIGNLPLSVGLVGMGFSDAVSGAFTLPLDLGLFGLTGCNLHADPAVTLFLVGASNVASTTLGVPADPSFLGLSIFTQAFSLDPAANGPGLTVSNAGRVRIGT